MAKCWTCSLKVSLNSSHAIMFAFRLIPLEKVWTPLFPLAMSYIVSFYKIAWKKKSKKEKKLSENFSNNDLRSKLVKNQKINNCKEMFLFVISLFPSLYLSRVCVCVCICIYIYIYIYVYMYIYMYICVCVCVCVCACLYMDLFHSLCHHSIHSLSFSSNLSLSFFTDFSPSLSPPPIFLVLQYLSVSSSTSFSLILSHFFPLIFLHSFPLNLFLCWFLFSLYKTFSVSLCLSLLKLYFFHQLFSLFSPSNFCSHSLSCHLSPPSLFL